MSYTKNTWQSGDVVTSAKLNHMEDGIEEQNMSYTKNTWQSGDVVTSAKLNHMEDGIEAASQGGSSDFTTAQVTLTDTREANSAGVSITGVFVGEYEFDSQIDATQGTTTKTIVLYKGFQIVYGDMESLTSISGDITGNLDDGFEITGDCTIVGVGSEF